MPLPGFFNRPVAPQQAPVTPQQFAPAPIQQPVAQPPIGGQLGRALAAAGTQAPPFRPAPAPQPTYAAPVAVPVQPAFQQQQPLTQGAARAHAPVQLSFAGAGSARSRSTRPDPLRQGHYALRLDRTRQDAPSSCQPLVSFIFTVVHVFDDANGQGHKVGDIVEHTIFKDKNPRYDYFFVEIKESIIGMLSITNPAEYTDDLVNSIFSDRQPLSKPAPIVVVANVRIKPPKAKKDEPDAVFQARLAAGQVKTNYYRDYKGRLKSHELAEIMPAANQVRIFGAIDPQHGVAQGLVAMAIQEQQDDAAQAPADAPPPPPPPA